MGDTDSRKAEQAILEIAKQKKLDIIVEQCSNIDEMLKFKTDRLPIILLNDEVVCFGRMPTELEILESIANYN